MKLNPKISLNHKNHDQFYQELNDAKQKVIIGGIYSHYKYPENTYRVTALGFTEATDEVCVIYQATYDPDLVFIRPVCSWLETPQWNGQKVPRFKLVSRKMAYTPNC